MAIPRFGYGFPIIERLACLLMVAADLAGLLVTVTGWTNWLAVFPWSKPVWPQVSTFWLVLQSLAVIAGGLGAWRSTSFVLAAVGVASSLETSTRVGCKSYPPGILMLFLLVVRRRAFASVLLDGEGLTHRRRKHGEGSAGPGSGCQGESGRPSGSNPKSGRRCPASDKFQLTQLGNIAPGVFLPFTAKACAQSCAGSLGPSVPPAGRASEPKQGQVNILRHKLAFEVFPAKIVLGFPVSGLRRFPEPKESLLSVGFRSKPVEVGHGKIALCFRATMLRRQSVMRRGFPHVFPSSNAGFVAEPRVEQCVPMPTPTGAAVPKERRSRVPSHSQPLVEAVANEILAVYVPGFSGL